MQSIIRLEGGVARNEMYRFTHPLTMSLEAGEHLAIVGPNASGRVYW